METGSEFLKLITAGFSKAFDRIFHGVEQLNDSQIWYRPSKNSNSIGIILQHLEGNLNQWVCSALGGETYHRNRAGEFKVTEQLSKKDILERMNFLCKKIDSVVSQIPAESLLSYKRIQGFDETIMSALIAALNHLELHSGQIIFISKLILEDNYKESWKPRNTEQGMDI